MADLCPIDSSTSSATPRVVEAFDSPAMRAHIADRPAALRAAALGASRRRARLHRSLGGVRWWYGADDVGGWSLRPRRAGRPAPHRVHCVVRWTSGLGAELAYQVEPAGADLRPRSVCAVEPAFRPRHRLRVGARPPTAEQDRWPHPPARRTGDHG